MKKKNVILLGILLLVAVTSGIVAVTYSRYMTTANGSSTANIAKWIIRVNGDDIVQHNTFDTNTFTWLKDENVGDVQEDYIAPGVTGVTSIVLDASEAMVDVEYTISVDQSALAAFRDYDQLQILIGEEGEEVNLLQNGVSAYTGTILRAETLAAEDVNPEDPSIGTVTIPVKIVWNYYDDVAHNTSDSTLGNTIDEISLPVTVVAKQLVTTTPQP